VKAALKLPRLTLPRASSAPALYDTVLRFLGVAFMLVAVIWAAGWLTELTAPRPVAKLPATVMAAPDAGMKMIGRLFGVSQPRSQAVEGLKLTGIHAGSGGGGFATFRTRSGEVSVFVGDEIAPGVKLKEIRSDHVIILNTGMQLELRLREESGAPAFPGPAAPRGAPSQDQNR